MWGVLRNEKMKDTLFCPGSLFPPPWLAEDRPIGLDEFLSAVVPSTFRAELYRANERETSVVEEAQRRAASAGQDVFDLVVDISKSQMLSPYAHNCATCVLPNSKLLRVATQELLSSVEHAALQGIVMRDFPGIAELVQSKRGRSLLRDMAGNAMTLPVIMRACLALVVTSEPLTSGGEPVIVA